MCSVSAVVTRSFAGRATESANTADGLVASRTVGDPRQASGAKGAVRMGPLRHR
jgi:hypothetical protein